MRRIAVKPIAVMPIGFGCIILIGALLLSLPAASARGAALPFLDALFTATSASCVTGLVVADTGLDFSLFGQIVILVLIQLGGLGFMTMSAILFTLFGKRVSLYDRMTIAEGLGESRLQGVVYLARRAVLVTLEAELVGAALLSVRFVPKLGLWRGLWFSLFHSISAFCNAGFDLNGSYASFTGYSSDAYVQFVLMALIVIGSLGFAVVLELVGKRRFRAFKLHTKLVVVSTLALLLGGALAFLCIEYDNPATLGKLPFFEKALNALFQSVTLRTAGFNTIDQLGLRDASKGVGILLMFIGGAPAGTAGGLKITTVLTLVLAVRAYIIGSVQTVAFGRTISLEQVRRALTIFFIGVLFTFALTLGISLSEQGGAGADFGIWNQLFEATSAFCTVGLSVGVSGVANTATRLMLILMMFMGRVGLVSVAMALMEGTRKREPLLRYPEEEILIG